MLRCHPKQRHLLCLGSPMQSRSVLPLLSGSFLIAWVCRIAANDGLGIVTVSPPIPADFSAAPVKNDRWAINVSRRRQLGTAPSEVSRTLSLSLFIAGSPHAAVLLLLSSSTVKVAPFEMTASIGSSNHMFFSPLVQFNIHVAENSMWLLEARSPRTGCGMPRWSPTGAFSIEINAS